jgi:hypothetical protein
LCPGDDRQRGRAKVHRDFRAVLASRVGLKHFIRELWTENCRLTRFQPGTARSSLEATSGSRIRPALVFAPRLIRNPKTDEQAIVASVAEEARRARKWRVLVKTVRMALERAFPLAGHPRNYSSERSADQARSAIDDLTPPTLDPNGTVNGVIACGVGQRI